MAQKTRILICGILPPPNFGHSITYQTLLSSDFVQVYDVIFLNVKFWSYRQHKKITIIKLFKLVVYLTQYLYLLLVKRPRYVFYGISFDKMPFLKDFLFCWLGRLLGARIVLHDHGQYLGELIEASGKFHRLCIRRLIHLTTAIVVFGEDTRKKYERFVNKEKILIVPGGLRDSNEIAISARQKNSDQIIVLYLSFLSRTKGIFTALKSVPDVVRKNPQVHFLFAGPFESEAVQQEIEEFVEQNHLKSHVQFLGYIDEESRRLELYRNADIFIFPTHRDVFGLVLLDAMSESLPVIASAEGTIPEVVIDGQSGFLFPKGSHETLAQKILFLAQDSDLRARMGKAGRERYQKMYTVQKYAENMIAAFQKIEKFV